MSKQFYITEFWTGPDGHRQLWHSETTETDPTGAIRAVPPDKLCTVNPPQLLIITFPVHQWTKPLNQNKV